MKKQIALLIFLVLIAISIVSFLTHFVYINNKTEVVNSEEKPCKDITSLDAIDTRIVKESKYTIIKSGLTENYFNQHFCVIDIIETASDVKVIYWKYSISEYEATLSDGVNLNSGFHRIQYSFVKAYDILSTISLSQAKSILQECLHTKSLNDTAIIYGPIKDDVAHLYITTSISKKSGSNYNTSFTNAFVDLETGVCTTQGGLLF